MRLPSLSVKWLFSSGGGVIILLIIVVAVGLHIAIPLREHMRLQEELTRLRNELDTANQLAPLHLSLQRMIAQDEWKDFTRVAPQFIARQEIIRVPSMLVDLAEAQGVALISVNPAVETTPRGRRLFVDLEVLGEYGALQHLLRAIADLPYFETYTEITLSRDDANDVMRGRCVLFVE